MAPPARQDASPTAQLLRVEFSDLTPDRALAHFTLRIANPSADPLHLAAARWLLTAHQQVLATGSADLPLTVDPHASADASVIAPLVIAEVLAACPAAEPGSIVPFTTRIDLVPDPTSNGRGPLIATGDADLPIPAPPLVELQAVRFDSLGWNRTDARLDLLLTNRCPFDLDIHSLELRLSLAGTTILTHVHRAHGGPVAFAPAGQRTLSIPVTLNPANLGFAAFTTLQQPEADYHLAAIAHCQCPHGPMTWHVDHADRVTLAPCHARTG